MKELETIESRIKDLEQAQENAIYQSRAERAKLSAKMTELEEKLKDPGSLEDYKVTAQEIRDTQAYIDFIDAKKNKVQAGLLNDAEFKDMRKTLEEEIKARQTDAAAEIQAQFYPIIELMEKYTADISNLDELLNRATKLNNPRLFSTCFSASKISEINPDKYEYWQQFCYMFFRHRPDVMRKKHAEAHPWHK